MSTCIFDVTTMPCRALVSYYCDDSLLPKACVKLSHMFSVDVFILANGEVPIVFYVVNENDLASCIATMDYSFTTHLTKPIIQCGILKKFRSPQNLNPTLP